MTTTSTTAITCPYCKHSGDPFEVTYAPFAEMANTSPFKGKDGDLARAAEVACTECNKKFLYRLTPYVKAETAPLPEYS